MIPKEILKQVHRIEITTSRLVTDVFAGQYHSVFKGQGIEFDEVREYQIGDDVRRIDWNVTAKTGTPHIKKFVEERESTVMLLVDASASCRFATVNKLKSQLAAEIGALLAFSATRNNDKVGLIIFTDRIEKYIPPRKGSNHVLRVIREVLYFKPENNSTDYIQVLEFLSKVMTRRTITFLISDYLDHFGKDEEETFREQLKKVLSIANKKHDVIAVTLNDPKELILNDSGMIVIEDAETGELRYLDTSYPHLRQRYYELNKERIIQREKLFRSVGIDYINVSTDSSYADAIIKFFLKRKRRIR